MASYRERVRQDLDRWIAAGLVAPDKREAIIATLPEQRRLDAATALAWIGGALLGIAVVAFVAANWDGMSRLLRFALVLAAFAAFAGGSAWAALKQRPLLTNILLTIAAIVFAAAVGLTGQIFDITGNPRTAAYIAGVAAFALALAGGSTGAACVGLVTIAVGDFIERQWFMGLDAEAPWMLIAAPLGAYLALRWSSSPLAHLSAAGILFCFGWFAGRFDDAEAGVFLFLAIMLGAMAAAARWMHAQERPFAGVFYGWFAFGAILFFIPAGYVDANESGFGEPNAGVLHRLVWLVLSGGLLALGRFDRHLMVTAIGVLSMICAIAALLMDYGVNLMTAAGVFLVCSVVALGAGLLLRRRKADA